MKQKVVSVLLALVMMLSLLPTAWAETPAGAGGAAVVNGIVYDVLEDAVAGAVDGDTITLLRDVTIKDTLLLDKTVTLDGGAYTITADATVSWKYDPADENSGIKSFIDVYGGSPVVLKNVTLDGSGLTGGVYINSAAVLENVTVKNTVYDWVLSVDSAQVTVVGNLTASSGRGRIELCISGNDEKVSVDITNANLVGINQFWTTAKNLTFFNIALDDYDSVYQVIGAAAKGFVKNVLYWEDGTLRGVEYKGTYGGTTAKTDDAVASVADENGTLYYDDLAAALDYAVETAGVTVTLLKDVTVTDALSLSNGVTLDGGSHTITADGNVSWKLDPNDENSRIKCLVAMYGDGSAVLKNVTLDGDNRAWGISVSGGVAAKLENVTVKNPVLRMVFGAYNARVTVVGDLISSGSDEGIIELAGIPTGGETSIDITNAALTGISKFYTASPALVACSVTLDNYDSVFKIIGAAAKGFVKKGCYAEDGTLDEVAYVFVPDTTDKTVSEVTIPADKIVRIDATDENAPDARTATVTIGKDAAKVLRDAAADDKVEAVEIKTNVATLTIDKAALKTLTSVEGDLVLRVTKSLVSAGETTFILTAQVDGKDVFTSSVGKITVTVPMDAPGPRQRLACYYVADNGARTLMGGAGYKDGFFSWDTDHFSTFVVVTEQISSPGHTETPTVTGKSTSATTFDAGVGIYAVSAILSVTGMAWVGRKKS